MKVKLLKANYLKNPNIYKDFLDNNIVRNLEYMSSEYVEVGDIELFPIYLAYRNFETLTTKYTEAFYIVRDNYIYLDRDITMNQRFWHSLLVTEFRDYIIEQHPEILDSEKKFKDIVLKKFDWENYIYKVVIAAQYLNDNAMQSDHKKYLDLIINNLDLYNYIIKYRIFRNDKFLLNVLDIVDKNNLSEVLKARIKHRPDLGKDERYGRRVIFEFNKNYPVIMGPMLTKEDIEEKFIDYLRMYYDGDLNQVIY